ncbi:UNVERIFIED_CONTAM: hypothetical protein H355_014248 [Colinus virginianus]|nr:hypothetical protein H355_014248 [Colinus virginianus]
MKQQPQSGAGPKRYVPPHLRNRSAGGLSGGAVGGTAASAAVSACEETAAAGYPDYPGASVGVPYPSVGGAAQAPPTTAAAPAYSSTGGAAGGYCTAPRYGLANGYEQSPAGRAPAPEEAVAEQHHGYNRGVPGRGMNSSDYTAGGGDSSAESTTAGAPSGAAGVGRTGGSLAALAAQQQQQQAGGGFSSRAATLQQGHFQGGGSAASGRSMSGRPSATGTGWDVRDGRRYIPEKEREVFSSDKMQSTGIKFDSYDKVPVELKGRGAETIVAIESFRTPGTQIHPLLLQNVAYVKYTKPTPIQKNSIPTILAGRDLMACAQTGSGKTAAFLFPIIARMLQSGPPPLPSTRATGEASAYRKATAYPVCLVLSPTRELAMQIYEEARKFQFGTGIRTVALYGGSDVKRQLFDLDGGCDICVATPGRLVDLLERRKVRLALVQFFVLDEADRMLDMGFLPQIKHIVEDFDLPPSPSSHQSPSGYPVLGQTEESGGAVMGGRPTGRQTVMFSATFPREIQMLAKDFLEDYIYLAVGRVGSTNEFIRQRLQYADEDQKLKLLVKLLRETEKGLTILFVETKRKADMIEDFLLEENFPAVSIHGDRSQQEREEALRLFKAGKRPILVATDVAARGLDISNVTHVINFDLPTNIDDYVHRIGRTGRAGNLGLATSFVNECNKPILRDLMKLLEEAKQEIPSFLPPLVLSCTSSSARMGNFRSSTGGWGGVGGGRGGGSNRSGGGGAFGSRTGGYAVAAQVLVQAPCQ